MNTRLFCQRTGYLLRLAGCASALLLLPNGRLSQAALFSVTTTNDAGPGSLRQAILDNNRTAGPNVIELAFTTPPPWIIKPQEKFLPPLKGPVVLRVKQSDPQSPRPVAELSPQVVLDGAGLVNPRDPSACPGATFSYNQQTGEWETTRVQGSGPNARGYFGPGLAVEDSQDVEISGVEIRNFCIGVLGVRSSNVNVHDVKIVDCHGAAGVIFTGDDGNAGRTEKSFNNRLANSLLLDNGDGFEFTRGTHHSLLQGNTISLTRPLPSNGNAVELAQAGTDNAIVGNTFSSYVSTAVTAGGTRNLIRDNRFIGNRSGGLSASGTGLLIEGNIFLDNGGTAISTGGVGTRVVNNLVSRNGGNGVSVGGRGVTVSQNSIFNNGQLGIAVSATGGGRGGGGRRGAAPAAATPTADAAAATPPAVAATPAVPAPSAVAAPAPAVVVAAPLLARSSTWTTNGVRLSGTIDGAPNQSYHIELFATQALDRRAGEESDWKEGERFLGIATSTTDKDGKGTFALVSDWSDPLGNGQSTAAFSATATDAEGSTSEFSRALLLAKVRGATPPAR